MATKPLLTIRCMAFNHAPFIRQCLEGFVMQKTNFPFEAVVHDDASTDGTADIIREYAERYPHIIKPIFEKENLWNKGDGSLQRVMDAAMRGKYVAWCEGDDYWTDPHKLQSQVDFLESHPEFSMAFHTVRVVYEDDDKTEHLFPEPGEVRGDVLELADFKLRNWAQTNSVVYRWRFREGCPTWDDLVPLGVMPADYMMHLLHAQLGKVHFDPAVRSVYRRHKGGTWWGDDGDGFFIRWGIEHTLFYLTCDKLFDGGFEMSERHFASLALRAYLRTGRIDLISRYSRDYPELFKTVVESLRFPCLEPAPTRREIFLAEYCNAAKKTRWLYMSYRLLYRLSCFLSKFGQSKHE